MKNKSVIAVIMLILLGFTTTAFARDTNVRGYYRNDGTYVQPHMRTSPNSSPYDNYSTKGNVNPYTGEKGYQDPTRSTYGSQPLYQPPQYNRGGNSGLYR